MDKILGVRLKNARNRRLKNQEDMAKLLGISKSTYSRKENNLIPFTQDELRKMKAYLELSNDEFMTIFFNQVVALKATMQDY